MLKGGSVPCPMCLWDLKYLQKQSSGKTREHRRPKSWIKTVALLLSGSHSPHYSHVQHAQKHFSTSEVSYIPSRNAVIIFLGTHFQFSSKKTNRKWSKWSYLINLKAAAMNNAGASKLFSACQKMASGLVEMGLYQQGAEHLSFIQQSFLMTKLTYVSKPRKVDFFFLFKDLFCPPPHFLLYIAWRVWCAVSKLHLTL